MSSRNALDVIVNTGGSPDNLFLWSGKDNEHWHEYDAALGTNRTGVTLVAGDVVRWSTANASSLVAQDVVGNRRPYAVVMATIADTAAGEVARGGRVLAKSTGAIVTGEYVRKSATAKAIETTGVGHFSPMPDTALGFAVDAAAGGFCLIELFPFVFSKTNNLLLGSGTDQNIANTTTETDITGSIATIAASTLSVAGGIVPVRLAGTLTGSDNTHSITFRLRYGASIIAALTIPTGKTGQTNALDAEPFVILADLAGHGAAAEQRGWLRYHGLKYDTVANALAASTQVGRGFATENSATALTLKATAQWSNADAVNSLVIEHARVEMPPT